MSQGKGRSSMGAGWGVAALIMVLAGLESGCARAPVRPRPVPGTEAYGEILARHEGFNGFQAKGTLTIKHQTESLSVPLEVHMSADLELEVTGEVSYLLLPFEGKFRLVSDKEATLLFTNAGVYDLSAQTGAPEAMRPFLLCLAGGGDCLLWWAAAEGCEVGTRFTCGGLDVELERDTTLPSVKTWEIAEPGGSRSFRAVVEEYEPGILWPNKISGTLNPENLSVYVKYSEISFPAGPGR